MSKRIVLLGCAGSGKSFLARQLASRTGAPPVCLDAIWEPGSDALERFRAKMTALHAGDAWISDGNFAEATFDIRLPRATLIVWLDRPLSICVWNVLTRVLRSSEAHKARDLGKVLAFIWRFDRINRPKIERNRLIHGPHVPMVKLRSSRDIASFLSSTAGASPDAALD